MIFFQFMTNGTLFKPLNLTNLVLQNSYVIIMALGMLLVIVAGYIDLSVGSVAGFIGASGCGHDGSMAYRFSNRDVSLPDRRRSDRRSPRLLDRLSQNPLLHRHFGGNVGLSRANPGACLAETRLDHLRSRFNN